MDQSEPSLAGPSRQKRRKWPWIVGVVAGLLVMFTVIGLTQPTQPLANTAALMSKRPTSSTTAVAIPAPVAPSTTTHQTTTSSPLSPPTPSKQPAAPTSPPSSAHASTYCVFTILPPISGPTPPAITDEGVFVLVATDGSSCEDNQRINDNSWTVDASIESAQGLKPVCVKGDTYLYAVPASHRAARMYCDPNYTGN